MRDQHSIVSDQVDLRREEADPLQINHLIIQPVALQLSADFLASAAQRGGPDAEPDASGERGELPQRALKARPPLSWCRGKAARYIVMA